MTNAFPVITTRWSSARPEDAFVVENPVDGRPFVQVRGSSRAEVDACVRAADKAFRETWRWVAPHERGKLLTKAARIVEAHFDEIAELETREEGKPLFISRSDTQRCIEAFDYYGGLIGNLPTDFYDLGPAYASIVLEPFGVVAGIIPFNWPPLHTAAKAAPALAVGNTVILKPGDQAPLVVMRIVELLQELFPENVLSVLTGPGAESGVALTAHPLVRKISFTGSTNSGRAVLRQSAENLTPCTMELGGKNPFIIMEGCQIQDVLPMAYEGAFYNNGQACMATSRILVHRSLHDEFVEEFAKVVRKIQVGDGMNPESHIGPLVSRAQQQRVLQYLDIGVREGATVKAQARLPEGPEYADGFFVPPTLLTDVTPGMRVAREEVFGPVTCVMVFDEPEEAVRIANDSDYGLVAVVYSPDAGLAGKVARELDTGSVYINNFYRLHRDVVPFGGTKNSGFGRERTIETLAEFGYHKTIKTPSGVGDIPLAIPRELS
jgi:acyl-CoA reductase-like NAD-dependent aldehyde dehydrogenase